MTWKVETPVVVDGTLEIVVLVLERTTTEKGRVVLESGSVNV